MATKPKPFDKAAYLRLKSEAARDPQVVKLSEKLDASAPGEAHKAAARDYTKALFSKMRKTETNPAQAEWLDRMEAATLRRIDAGKPFVAE